MKVVLLIVVAIALLLCANATPHAFYEPKPTTIDAKLVDSRDLLFTAFFTGKLTENRNQTSNNRSLDCIAAYDVDTLDILVVAGVNLRYCAHINDEQLLHYIEQYGIEDLNKRFTHRILYCSERRGARMIKECYVDAIWATFSHVRPYSGVRAWKNIRCIRKEVDRLLSKLGDATVELTKCVADPFSSSDHHSHMASIKAHDSENTTLPPQWNTTESWNTTWPQLNTTLPPYWNTTEGWNTTWPQLNTTLPPQWNTTEGWNTTWPQWNTTESWNTTWPQLNTTLPPQWNTTEGWNTTVLHSEMKENSSAQRLISSPTPTTAEPPTTAKPVDDWLKSFWYRLVRIIN